MFYLQTIALINVCGNINKKLHTNLDFFIPFGKNETTITDIIFGTK